MKISDITDIVIHCSATIEGSDIGAKDIKEMHLRRGFSDIGYHFIVRLDGTVEHGRDIDVMGAHVKGHNSNSIGICYVGGLDKYGHPKDTRTPAQSQSMLNLIDALKKVLPNVKNVGGHRDYSPDINGDGTIQANEYIKQCPCFDVADWLDNRDWQAPLVYN